LGFFTKKLEASLQKYSAFASKRLFACYSSIRDFPQKLYGSHIAVNMEQKPLTFSLARVWDLWTARQGRHLSHGPEFTSDIHHIAGSANMVADAHSMPSEHAAAGGPPTAEALPGLRLPPCREASKTPLQLETTLPSLAAGVAVVQPNAGISFTNQLL
jgi:hypothetical protein